MNTMDKSDNRKKHRYNRNSSKTPTSGKVNYSAEKAILSHGVLCNHRTRLGNEQVEHGRGQERPRTEGLHDFGRVDESGLFGRDVHSAIFGNGMGRKPRRVVHLLLPDVLLRGLHAAQHLRGVLELRHHRQRQHSLDGRQPLLF